MHLFTASGAILPAQNHQTSHFFTGFILEPTLHWKSLENSLEFWKGPRILNMPGECAPVFILCSRFFFLYLEHQTLAAESQKS